MNKRFKMTLLSLALALSAALSLGLGAPASAAVDNDPDCDTVAIIRCGVFSRSALREKAAKNDVPKIYRAFDISQNDLKGEFAEGIVWRDGRVTVDGKVVATNAKTAGRNYGGTPIEGTNAGIYSTSKFVTEGQTAFVKMIDGKFSFAVIKSCGNPVSATPKEPKKPSPKPEYACVSLKALAVSRTKFTFTAEATATNGATIEQYEFGFGDGMGVTLKQPTYTYEYKNPGTFTASVIVHVKVNDTVKKVTADACKTAVTVADEQMRVCELATKKVITINKADFDATKHTTDLTKCAEAPVVYIDVCDLQTRQIIRIKEADFDNDRHSKNLDNCKVTPVTYIDVCELSTKKVIRIKASDFDSSIHSKTLDDCKEQPPVIASTGPAAILSGVIGSGSLGYGAYSYLSTRRKLLDKFLGR